MSYKMCPLMMISKPQNPHSSGEDYQCYESECAWWRQYKTGYACTVVVLTMYLEGIGRLAAFGAQERRVGIKT